MSAQVPSSRPRDVYLNAVKLSDPTEREAYLYETCADDSSLRERVEELLAAREQRCENLHDQGDACRDVEGSDPEATQKYDPAAMDLEPGRILAASADGIDVSEHPLIGPYKLLQDIGQGGMGTVYMAEQVEPVKRKVALKIIKPGMDSKDVLARFEAERQALAMMDHPSIAKVLDGGTTETGRPYFVMELVHGTPVTRFCDEAGLSTRERLELFVDVCRAVQHAHLKGIIHRDLKPSNVLVTMSDGRPLPKVIDFGLAKALSSSLTEKTLFTAYGQMVGTPLYMSPEQAEFSAHDVDIRSDIYSLGVMLYELLTGTTPFDKDTLKKSGLDEMRRLIREVDPPRPSTRVSTLDAKQLSTVSSGRRIDAKRLRQSLQGELDWIVMKALEKDRGRRYESASAFAADVLRYLDDEPVQACPPSVSYRLKKFATKHKAWLTTAVLLVVVLLTGTGVATWQAIRASEAEQFAQERLEEVEKERKRSDKNLKSALDAIDRLLISVGEPDLYEIPGAQPVCRKIIKDALDFYEEFAKENATSTQIRLRAGRTWKLLGDVMFETRGPWDRTLRRAQKILEKLASENPDNRDCQLALADCLMSLAYVNGQQAAYRGDKKAKDTSQAYYRRAAGLYEDLSRQDPANAAYLSSHAKALLGLGRVLGRRSDEALEIYQRAYGLIELSGDKSLRADLFYRLAQIYEAKQVPVRADEYFRRAAVESTKNRSAESPRLLREQHASRLHEIADSIRKRHPQEATKYWREALNLRLEIVKDYPDIRTSAPRAGNTATHFARHLVSVGRFDEARDVLKKTPYEPGAGYHFKRRARTHFELRNFDQALADLKRAFELDPKDVSSVWWIPAHEVAACPDVNFKRNLREFADRVVMEKNRSTDSLIVRAPLLIAFEDYEQAEKDLVEVVRRDEDDLARSSLYYAGLLSVFFNKSNHFKTICSRMLRQFSRSENDIDTYFIAWTCALAPNALDDYKPAVKFARHAVEKKPGNQQYLNGLGAILLRAGKHEQAKEQLTKALKMGENTNNSPSYIHYFLAMTEHHLGNSDAAQQYLQAANASAEKELADSPAWNRKLTLELLRKEAEALIGKLQAEKWPAKPTRPAVAEPRSKRK